MPAIHTTFLPLGHELQSRLQERCRPVVGPHSHDRDGGLHPRQRKRQHAPREPGELPKYVGMSVVSYGVHMSARLYVYMSLVCICIYGPTCTCVRTIDMHVSALLTCMRLVGVACVLCAHGRVRATVPSGVPNTRGTLR